MPDPYKGFDLSGEAGNTPGGKNYLLAIAIDEYAHCPKLNNCVKDAREFIEVLTARYQFEPENAITLFNAEATHPQILAALKKLKGQVGPHDNLVIYFSGHGETEDNIGYWAPVNAHPGQEWGYVSTDDIRRRLDAIDSFHTFVIVDACFSGTLFATYKSATPGYENKRSRWGLAASHSRERALDGTAGDNSPFAATLLRQLRGSPGHLPVQDLAAAVIRQVEQATEGRQTPVFKPLNVRGDDSGQYVFRLRANEAADWKACREAGTVGAYRAFLAQYPEGAHAGAARATLAKLEEEAAWAKASEKNAVASYNAYLGRFPAGPHADEAFQRIRQLEDDAGWSESKRIDRAYAYWDYLRRFPGGRNQEQARARIQ
ncbi:MAG: caspase family protein [Phaeodactylibacter sp.]|nr:caspase family protein [Phaeodactylibacter sp.]